MVTMHHCRDEQVQPAMVLRIYGHLAQAIRTFASELLRTNLEHSIIAESELILGIQQTLDASCLCLHMAQCNT